MATKYPASIDGYAEIRVARDGIDEIIAGDHNDLRSAILAIERTLGVNPQGPFGTVVARLNDAYNNIEAHVLGHPPRHMDDVIMSPVRTGMIPGSAPLETLPYSLVSGSLAAQVSRMLEFLNDSLMYAGSGTSTFADGYALGFSLVRNAITQIVEQLGGGTTGTTKISGASIVGTNFSIPPGTLRVQLVSLLNLIDAFGNPTGAGLVGATGFSTSTGDRYTFSGTHVQDQIEEAGLFHDEAASFREKAFNAFIASGCAVSGSAGTANIASGFIAANGRMISYGGGSVSISDGTTSYVYAEISNSTITVSASTSIPTRPENPVVLLHKIVRSGATWTTSIDLRRYGVFVNDKNYVSVGNTPSAGRDGYGCDFTSLKSAVEYAKTLNNGNELIPPMKILLASDISITSADEMEIALNVEGIEIDGCGRKITTNIDAPLFSISADNVTVRDLTLESDLASSGSALCLALVGNAINVDNLTITNNKLLKTTATACPYFLRLGSAGGTTVVSNAIISENIAEVELGGIEYTTTNTYAQVLRDSVILGNNIYQGNFSSSSRSGIKASQHCTVGDNIIKGGFNTGILLAFPTQCRVDGNLIIGYQSSAIYMSSGIAIWNSAPGQDNGCVVSDNTIKGIANYGINCRAGAGSGAFISVYGNYIDNYHGVGTPPSTMIAIKGRGAETWVVGNKITAPGAHAIESCSHAIGNQIYGHSSITTTSSAIEMSTSTIGVVADNTIRGVAGTGIHVSNNTGVVISGNALLGNGSSSTGINYVGSECMVIGNTIMDYNSGGIQSVSGTEITVSGNRIIDCQGSGVSFDDCSGAVVTNNWLECPVGTGSFGIGGIGSRSVIANNYVANYGAGGYYGIELYWGANLDTVIAGNVVTSLHINTQGAFYSPGGWQRLSVVGNLLDNCPAKGFEFADATQVLCANNVISGDSTSSYGIKSFGSESIISGNMIETYCTLSSQTAISATSSADNVMVANNHITNCNGHGIDMNGGDAALIVNNFMRGAASAGSGIIGANQYSIINNNLILEYGGLSGSKGIEADFSSGKMVISGNVIYIPRANMDYGIYLPGDIFYVIANNLVGDQWNPVAKSPIYVNGASSSIIVNNMMGGSQTGTAGDHAIKNVGGRSVVSGNLIIQANEYAIELAGNNIMCVNNIVESPYDSGILVGSSLYCIVDGNIVQGSGGAGIEVTSGSSDCSANNNYITGGAYGIVFDSSSFCVAVGNHIDEPKFVGIGTDSAHYCSVVGNYISISTGANGITLADSERLLVSSNYVYNSVDSGIVADNADYISILNNIVYSAGSDAISISDSAYSTANSNTINFGAGKGMYVHNSVASSVSNNYILQCDGVGIHLSGSSSSCAVSGNCVHFPGGSSAIQIDEDYCTVIGNTIRGNTGISPSYGIRGNVVPGGLGYSTISGNSIINVVDYPIRLSSTSHGAVISNNITINSVWGISLNGADDCVVSGNLVYMITNTAYHCGGSTNTLLMGNKALSAGWSVDSNTSDGLLMIGNWFDTTNTFGIGSGTQYVIIGNMCESGSTPSGWTYGAGSTVPGTNFRRT